MAQRGSAVSALPPNVGVTTSARRDVLSSLNLTQEIMPAAKNFSKKALTLGKSFGLMSVFPLKRKEIFETYFVRLIGTPNQHIPNKYIGSHFGDSQ
jgi:hypothetical protein